MSLLANGGTETRWLHATARGWRLPANPDAFDPDSLVGTDPATVRTFMSTNSIMRRAVDIVRGDILTPSLKCSNVSEVRWRSVPEPRG